uniref:Uncharacterized protein n=1 Tax=Siphoviridae sp. ctq1q8 TaxID=2826467 RepID=A0A8S5MFV1_9CAUD|nr:MAG TPA: hypothetical protein [Siphoviridae sp. ctq1q8]
MTPDIIRFALILYHSGICSGNRCYFYTQI